MEKATGPSPAAQPRWIVLRRQETVGIVSCDICRQLVDIADITRPYTVKTCTCGRKIKQRRAGDHGIGLRIEAGDAFVMPAEALRLAANPLKGSGQFSRAGLAWFAELIFQVDLAKRDNRDRIQETFQAQIDANEQTLRNSALLKGIDFESTDAGDQIWERLSKDQKSIEWWAYFSASLYSLGLDAIKKNDAVEAAWATAAAERFRTLALFREHFEEVVYMGHSARRLIELLRLWDTNRDNADEEFWQATLSAHAYAISQLFSVPVTVIKEKAYVGGMTLERTDSRLLDFMLSGSLSDDAMLLEIKTPTARLLGSQYRTNAYPPSNELGGAIVQVSDYCQTFRENIQALTRNLGRSLTAFNPKRLVLIGNRERELDDDKKRASFELFRGTLTGVEVVTFDEFFKKVENLAKLFSLVRTPDPV